ncbi:MAG: hypothetical protein IJU23_13640, partial [Proteobacteria bacterium]|nr:hypothetical protein [Pseudomonadota bacterium]
AMNRIFGLFLGGLMCIAAAGCSSSSAVIAQHFDNMQTIAETHRADCSTMGKELLAYLDANRKSLSSAVLRISSSEPEEARRIFTTSMGLHEATQHCQNGTVEEFRKSLSEVILQPAP